MGKPSAPTPPDPRETAAAQTGQNIATTIAQQQLNNVNQVTPDGSLTYNQTGTYDYVDPNSGETYALPTYTATQTLSEAGQQAKDLNDQTAINLAGIGRDQSSRIGDLLSEPVDLSSLPNRADYSQIQGPEFNRIGAGPQLQGQIADAGQVTNTYNTDFSQDRQRVENALLERLNPSLERGRSQLEDRLASQGIRIGSQAYQDAIGDQGRQENDARLATIIGAGQEQSRLAGLEAQRAGFENAAQAQAFGQNAAQAQFANQTAQQGYQNDTSRTAANNQIGQNEFANQLATLQAQDQSRNQALNETFAARNQPINEISALLSGSQVSNPNFVNPNTAQLANVDVAGLINNGYDQEFQNYQQRLNSWNETLGALGGIGGAYVGRPG